tara:strand:+ start:2760 stop:2936 length:177 start_codon:yes stop_codon:yes gene_type:complete
MVKTRIIVKILKSKTDNLWYKNKIGQQFKVKKTDDKTRYYMKYGENQRIIYKEDCEEI